MVGNQEEERKSVYFSRQKNVKGGVLIFVVADIWNCYNMDMFKLRYKQEYSADLSKTSLQLPVDIFPYLMVAMQLIILLKLHHERKEC